MHSIVDIQFAKNTVNDGFIYDQTRKYKLKKTKREVMLLVAISNGMNTNGTNKISKSWNPLEELKALHLLEVSEFVFSQRVDEILDFA